MNWDTVQPIEVGWLLIALASAWFMVYLEGKAREDDRNRVASGLNGQARTQAFVMIWVSRALLVFMLAAALVAVPALFLEPRVDVGPDPRWAAGLSTILSPLLLIVMLLCGDAVAGLLWWGRREIDRHNREDYTADLNAALQSGAEAPRRRHDRALGTEGEDTARAEGHLEGQIAGRDAEVARSTQVADVKADTVRIKADTRLLVESAEIIGDAAATNVVAAATNAADAATNLRDAATNARDAASNAAIERNRVSTDEIKADTVSIKADTARLVAAAEMDEEAADEATDP